MNRLTSYWPCSYGQLKTKKKKCQRGLFTWLTSQNRCIDQKEGGGEEKEEKEPKAGEVSSWFGLETDAKPFAQVVQ